MNTEFCQTILIIEYAVLFLTKACGKRVGAQIGTAGANEVAGIDGAILIAYDEIDQAFAALENGELDAVVADNTLALNYIGRSGGALKAAGGVYAGRDIAIAVCNKNPALLDRINRGLAEVKTAGTIDLLTGRWLQGS